MAILLDQCNHFLLSLKKTALKYDVIYKKTNVRKSDCRCSENIICLNRLPGLYFQFCKL